MYKKQFNRTIGETRQCKTCSNEFHTNRPIWYCNRCVTERSKISQKQRAGEGNVKTGKFAGMAPKKPYPFDTRSNKALSRFRRIKRELNKCNTKEERRLHYAKQLKEIEENGILEWIMDRRDDETAKERKAKSKSRTRIDYPNTRGHYEY